MKKIPSLLIPQTLKGTKEILLTILCSHIKMKCINSSKDTTYHNPQKEKRPEEPCIH